MNVNKILFIGLSNVGDVVMTTPVMKTLHNKYPQASFDIVTDKRAQQLYENYPFLNKIYLKDKDKPLRGVPALLMQLWKNRYDIIVDVRTDGLAYLLRGKKRYTKWSAKSYGPHAVEEIMGVVQGLHGNAPIPNTEIWLSRANRDYASKKLSVFSNIDKLLSLSVGDSRKPEKSLTTKKFIELLNKHKDDFSGVIFLGNQFETEMTLDISNNIDIKYINTVENSLLDAAALIEKSCLYLGPDSGLGHIASAVGVPTISFFSSMNPVRFRPWGGQAICITGANNDARNIPVDEVSAAIKSKLNE
jgi:lipopolysaccharide heptosyltransferase III